MSLDYIMTIFSFMLGLAVGSFLNVCIYRIPLKKSIVNPPSSCPQCGERIRFYDNIPLISYIVLLGRCRKCGKPISIGYPLVELIMGLLSLSLFVKYKLSHQYFLFLVFSASLIVISFIDLRHQIIPDIISIPGIAIGLIISLIFKDITCYTLTISYKDHLLISLIFRDLTWYDSLIGVIAGGGILYLIAYVWGLFTGIEAMGGGDVKLLAMIGAWMGWLPLPFIIMISALTGAVIGGLSLLFTRQGLRAKIPFGPFLTLGAFVYLFFGNELVLWYFQLYSY